MKKNYVKTIFWVHHCYSIIEPSPYLVNTYKHTYIHKGLLCKPFTDIIVFGDYNAHYIAWPNHSNVTDLADIPKIEIPYHSTSKLSNRLPYEFT